jgi:demethylmenaquinone methyltransferase/2-methoxy-6-polyprenyl-1,4-benzoquinol methylase
MGNLLPVMKELMRVTRPGGKIAILAWSSQQLLPGYPMLEARLNATCSVYAPYFTGMLPQAHFMRALGAFHHAGLQGVTAQTFVGQVQAPLSGGVRQALFSLFQMLWGTPQPGVAPEDWAEFRRLCLSESDECILSLPDYYAFFTYTMFQGSLPG